MKHVFIVNPKAGREDMSASIREYTESRDDLESLVFTSEYAGHETELAQRFCDIFDDEPLRLYACGGSGTLCRMLSGIPDLSRVEVAFFPCGATNDFLKCFKGESYAFANLRKIIEGKPILMDVLDFGMGKALNSISSGFEAKVAGTVNDFPWLSFLGRTVPYSFSIVSNFFRNMSQNYSIEIDGNTYDGKYGVVTAMNGPVYAGHVSPIPVNCPNDGMFKVILVDIHSRTHFLKFYSAYAHGRLDDIGHDALVLDAKKITVKVSSNQHHYFMADGEIFDPSVCNNQYTMRILPSALKFVIPDGVTLKDNCTVKNDEEEEDAAD